MTFKPYPHVAADGSFDRGFAELRAKVARRIALGPYAEQVSIGLRRDLSVAVEPPAVRIPISLRDFREDDLATLFPAGGDAAARSERTDIEWRLRASAHGILPSRCYVVVDDRSGRPCHIQWLTGPGYGDAIRRAGALPVLADDEAMLENAFTPVEYRGLGLMAAAVHLIAERARVHGKRHLLAFVDAGNVASLKAAGRAGLTPWSTRTRRQFGFGFIRTVRFDLVAAGSGSSVPSLPQGGIDGDRGGQGTSSAKSPG